MTANHFLRTGLNSASLFQNLLKCAIFDIEAPLADVGIAETLPLQVLDDGLDGLSKGGVEIGRNRNARTHQYLLSGLQSVSSDEQDPGAGAALGTGLQSARHPRVAAWAIAVYDAD